MDFETLALLGIVGVLVYYSGALDSLFGSGTTASVSNFFTSVTGTAPAGNIPTACPNTSGPQLAPAQIGQYASSAGFTGPDLITAVAVCLAESSGNPLAWGDCNLPPSGSYGLWQIYSGAHPEFGPDFTSLFDPQTNANAAYSIYRNAGQQFTPWTGTFGNGKYLAFMPTAQAALGG